MVPSVCGVFCSRATSLEVSKVTRGYFDVTVYPAVKQWGFASDRPPLPVHGEKPTQHLLDGKVPSYRDLDVRADPPALRKRLAHLQIDLSSIAKGYTADLIHDALKNLNYKDFLVEIGGELRSSGKNTSGLPWRVGIEKTKSRWQEGGRLRGLF